MMMIDPARPPLDQLLDEAAIRPLGPAAWARILAVYPELTMKDLAWKFEERIAAWSAKTAAELRKRQADLEMK
jgi:hypothetical protein